MTPAELRELMHAYWLVLGAVVGACLGSFANVVIARVPAGLSIVRPASRCPGCGTAIRARDNIPIVSWLVLRGRARCCGIAISPRYVLVEVLGAALGFGVVLKFGPGVPAVFHGLVALFLVCIAFIDLDTFTVPRPLSLGMVVLGLAYRPLNAFFATPGGMDALLAEGRSAAIGAATGFGVLFVTRVVSTRVLRATGRLGPDEDAMGTGDEHILAGIGAVVGASGALGALVVGSFAGSMVAVVLRVFPRHGGEAVGRPITDAPASQDPPAAGASSPTGDDWVPPEGAIQFGPFLAVGALWVMLLGSPLPAVDLGAVVSVLAGAEPEEEEIPPGVVVNERDTP